MSKNAGNSRSGGRGTGGSKGNTRGSSNVGSRSRGRGGRNSGSNRTTGNNQAGFGSVISRVAAAIAGAFTSGKKKKTEKNGSTKRPPSTLDSGRYTHRQLDKKFKHAKDFGVTDTRKNSQTLAQYRNAIDRHLADKDTVKRGTYALQRDSVVHFNNRTNNVVITDKNGKFISGWKLDKNRPQYKHYMEKGVLR